MGRVNWPLYDIRQDPEGDWQLLEITNEPFSVSSVPDTEGYYSVFLVELPSPAGLDGSNTAPVIEAPVSTVLTLTESSSPSASEVFINYETGQLVLHSSKAGLTGIASYWGRGSLVEAADLNDLDERVTSLEGIAQGIPGATGLQGIVGATGSQGLPGATGLLGTQGQWGATGPFGYTGPQGGTGVQGLPGIGQRGHTGPVGYTGPVGWTGLEGNLGITGIVGLRGATGIQGQTGVFPQISSRYQSPLMSGTTWNVNHNLGDYPIIQAYNTSWIMIAPQQITSGATSAQIVFPSSTSGYAVCLLGGEYGPQGPTGPGVQGVTGPAFEVGRYEEDFLAPSTIWILEHGIGDEPLVQVFDQNDRLLNPTGINNGANTSTVYFSTPQQGYAIALSGGRFGETGLSGHVIDTFAISINLSGGQTAIQPGIAGDLRLVNDGYIELVSIVAGETGSIQIDIWRDEYSNFPPTDADSITASSPVTITNGIKSEDSVLSGWDRELYGDQCLRFYIDSCSNIIHANVLLEMTPIEAREPSSSSSSSTSSSSSSSSSLSLSSSSSSSSSSISSSSMSSSSSSSSSA